MPEYSVVGKPLPRVDAKVKVTGQAKYAADLELPDMLWGKLAGIPCPHARILNIDTSRAERLPGVKAVITGKEFGGYTQIYRSGREFRGYPPDMPPLAVDKVRYYGEPVAGVAAIDEDIAEEAAELIKVDYEELPGVFEPEVAMKDGMPQVSKDFKNNICIEYHWNFGDVEKGFSESYLVREDRFRTGRVASGYVEPPAILAYYDPSGYVTVWPAKSSPFTIYYPLMECFRLPYSKVRVIQPFIGGSFGGTKNMSYPLDFCAVLLSKKSGKPVKIVYSQEETLTVGSRRHPAIIDIKTGVKRDGTLVALQTRAIADAGAYYFLSSTEMYLEGGLMALPYKLPNFKYDGYAVLTNNPVSTAMRGFGVHHTRFAAEIQLEMIAEELGIDPVELRLKNAIENPQPGSSYETVNKHIVKSCGVIEAIEKVAESPIWKERGERKKKEGNISRGTGFSSGSFETGVKVKGWHNACAAIIRVLADGSVNLLTGATDAGQGSDVVLCQIAAEELGVALEDIDIKRVDTAYTPVDPGTWGSRVTFMAGKATQAAAADAKQQLLEVAAKQFGVKVEDVDIKDRKAFVKADPEKGMPWHTLVRIACYSGMGAVIIGRGYSKHEADCDFSTGIGSDGTAYSFAAQAAEVEVDMETGQIRCINTTIAQDCGRPLNPMSVEGQNEGGSIQALGGALYEDFMMDKGKTVNPTFLDYKMCRSTDVPKVEVIHVITDDPDAPFGAKEASEVSVVTTPPAVVSAIHDAIGVWFKELPVTPEKVIKALKGVNLTIL